MELKFLADIIKEVLVKNDVACLPGLGAFTTEEVPAYFSDKGFTINPPYLKVVFNTSILKDTALVDFYADNNGISKSVAMSVVSQAVSDLRQELTSARAVLLPDLGLLRLTLDGSIFFVAAENLDIFPQYDLLEPVSLRHLPAVDFVSPVIGSENASEHESQSESEPIPAPQPEPEPVLELAGVPEPEPELKGKPRRSVAAVVAVTIVVLAILFFAALAILGRTCPDLVDPLLYSAEELNIIHQI